MSKTNQPCRLCLSQYPKYKLKNIFTCKLKDSKDSLVDVLFWVFSVEIDVTDPYAKDICQDCLVLVQYVVEVRNMFRKNQESLKQDRHENRLEELSVQSLDTTKKSELTKTSDATTSSSFENAYEVSSSSVRVNLSTLESLCPLRINIERLRTPSDSGCCKQLDNGRLKKRKYGLINSDDDILDEICTMLDDQKCISPSVSKRDVGVSTDLVTEARAVNTDGSYMSNLLLSVNEQLEPSAALPNSKENGDCEFDDNMVDILQITQNISSSLLSTDGDANEYNWTRMGIQEVSTNTQSNPTRNIGINAQVDMVEVGTLTKRFRTRKKKDVVQVNTKSLDIFSPRVWLEPVEYYLGRENYIQIDDFCFTKDVNLSEGEQTLSESDDRGRNGDESENELMKVKKQRCLDYYKNFSSFAVRELIAGKKIRENDVETTPVVKLTNVRKVFVCNFCSHSFLSEAFLNLHCTRKHNYSPWNGLYYEVRKDKGIGLKKVKRRRGRTPGNRKLPLLTETKPYYTTLNGENKSESCTKLKKQPKVPSCKKFEAEGSKNSLSSDNSKWDNPPDITTESRITNCDDNDLTSEKRMRNIPSRKQRRPEISTDPDPMYIWDRKGLGKYSAINMYKKHQANDKQTISNFESRELSKKPDLSLDETIRKLAGRLDHLQNSVSDTQCDPT